MELQKRARYGEGLKKPFEWKDRDGDFHTVSSMDTKHLFFTVRMIWNHSMPEEARIGNYIKYAFSSFYTKQYMVNAVRAMLLELIRRLDSNSQWFDDILFMRCWSIEREVFSKSEVELLM